MTDTMNTRKTLTSSLEDYLEAIYQLSRENKAARVREISKRVGVNSSSVTGALHALAERNLINYAPYDIATLTPEGERIAARISHRHLVLKDFFVKVLGVEAMEAEDSACRIEHVVSETILDRLAQFVDFIQVCPRLDINWIEETGYFCERPDSPESCERCIRSCLNELEKTEDDHG
jgi:DtxR family Mn-dependent transcriptional regulator